MNRVLPVSNAPQILRRIPAFTASAREFDRTSSRDTLVEAYLAAEPEGASVCPARVPTTFRWQWLRV